MMRHPSPHSRTSVSHLFIVTSVESFGPKTSIAADPTPDLDLVPDIPDETPDDTPDERPDDVPDDRASLPFPAVLVTVFDSRNTLLHSSSFGFRFSPVEEKSFRVRDVFESPRLIGGLLSFELMVPTDGRRPEVR